ncbi:hypothetical protein Tco_0832378 [Tanacetum coccineum]
MQELLLKLMNNLQILKGIQQEKKEMAAQSVTPYWNFCIIDDEEARENIMKDICTILRKFSRIPFRVTPKVILIAWERFSEIEHALADKQYRQEDIQELMSKLLEDVRNISDELSEYINCPSWNRPIFYDNDDDEYTIIYRKHAEITPDLPIKEPDNSLIMGDEYLDTIPRTSYRWKISTSDLEIVILEEVNDVDQEKEEFDLENILQIQDIILREKLLNINRLIANIESLNDNSTPNFVLKSPSPFPIPDSNSFFEKFDTSLSYLDDSLPEFESFSHHTKETSSGSTTTHANNSLTEYDSFHFEIEPDQGQRNSGRVKLETRTKTSASRKATGFLKIMKTHACFQSSNHPVFDLSAYVGKSHS